jgi:hypothetical protein
VYEEQAWVSGRKLMKPGSELNRTPVPVLYWGLNGEPRSSFDKSGKGFADLVTEKGRRDTVHATGGVRICPCAMGTRVLDRLGERVV